jgi:hypothetical protein
LSARSPIVSLRFFGSLLLGIGWPLVAAADEAHDPGELGHGIALVGMIALPFLAMLAFGIWLLFARLRSDREEAAAKQRQPNFERLWFPGEGPPKAPPQ